MHKQYLYYILDNTRRWLKSFICKHDWQIIYEVESIDNECFGTGGTLIYHRKCVDCTHKNILHHFILPNKDIYKRVRGGVGIRIGKK